MSKLSALKKVAVALMERRSMLFHEATWSTWSAVINLTSRAGELSPEAGFLVHAEQGVS